jgi:RNA polymerase sigma factor (sigma-70 family)
MEREPVAVLRAMTGMTQLPTALPPAVEEACGERPTDAQLIASSRDSPDDFALVFDRHAVAIHGYIARRLGSAEADDLVGQTFLIAFERRHRYDEMRADARPWLYGIATNLVGRRRRDEVRQFNAYARTGIDRDSGSFVNEVANRLDAEAASRALYGVLAGLRPVERDVLLHYAWEELSYPEIAQALDIPIGTVRSRLHRARQALRSALGSNFEDTDQ